MKLYLDNCCFNRPYDDQSQLKVALETQAKLYIQHAIANNVHSLVWSYILSFENSRNPYEERKKAISEWENLAVDNVSESEELLAIAENIAKTGVKESDSLHIACGIIAHCDYFITTDRRILKYLTDKIKIVSPIEFVEGREDHYES